MQPLEPQDARTLSDFLTQNWTAFVAHMAQLEDLDYDDDPEGDSEAAVCAEEIRSRLNDLAEPDLDI